MKIRFSIFHCLTWLSFFEKLSRYWFLNQYLFQQFSLQQKLSRQISWWISLTMIYSIWKLAQETLVGSHFYDMCQTWGFTNLGWRFEFFNSLQFKFLKICKIKKMIPLLLNPFKTNQRTSSFSIFNLKNESKNHWFHLSLNPLIKELEVFMKKWIVYYR
jgi:hypothetical protein